MWINSLKIIKTEIYKFYLEIWIINVISLLADDTFENSSNFY